MAKRMTDEEREARAEERAAALRSKRILKVLGALSKTKRKTTRQISDETGYSVSLVRSTINMIRRQTDAREGSAVAYDPQTHEFWIPRTWDEHEPGVNWLAKHAATRVRSLAEFLDVAVAIFGRDVPVDLLVAVGMTEATIDRVDAAVAATEQRHEKGKLGVNRGVKLHG
jgi:hypothetical protein